jgi:hypothetical protein
VDAEIGDTSDVLIDDRTRAAMQAVAPPQSSAAAAPATVAIPAQKPNASHRSRHSSTPYLLVFFTFLWMRWRARKGARH